MTLSTPLTTRPFLRAKKSKVMSIFLSFFGIPDLKPCSVLFTVLLIKHSIPQTFTVYEDIAISFLTEFLAEFLTDFVITNFDTLLKIQQIFF